MRESLSFMNTVVSLCSSIYSETKMIPENNFLTAPDAHATRIVNFLAILLLQHATSLLIILPGLARIFLLRCRIDKYDAMSANGRRQFDYLLTFLK